MGREQDPGAFVLRYFAAAQGIAPDAEVTRIEWRYVETEEPMTVEVGMDERAVGHE